jgi:cephalosporin-C deacetylase-like acetyl esterase
MQEESKPSPARPVDFESFWKDTREELRHIPLSLKLELLAQTESAHIEWERASFVSFGGVNVTGYLLRWKDGKQRPLVIHSHGYNSQCTPKWEWGRAGMNVFGVDIRGFGLSTEALPHRSLWGYMLTGIESRESYVLRGAICDYIQAIWVGKTLLGAEVSRTVLQGTGFAGGLALMAEAASQVADVLALADPTFGWCEGRPCFVKAEPGSELDQYLEERPEAAEDLERVLRYFDPMNFAESVVCPTLVGLGSRDVAPARSVRAIANHLAGPHRVMEFPVSQSTSAAEELWKQFDEEWIRLALHGVPANFGKD